MLFYHISRCFRVRYRQCVPVVASLMAQRIHSKFPAPGKIYYRVFSCTCVLLFCAADIDFSSGQANVSKGRFLILRQYNCRNNF